MRFTDLFIKRPVLAIVVNLVILIAGLQSIRALSVRQYPRSDIAVVRVSTTYVGANADLVRGFITTPLERVIASADGIDFVESSSAQSLSTILVHLNLNYDTNDGADADPGQGGAGPQRPAARGRGAADRAGDGRQPVRRAVSELLVARARSEPDHRLPHPRRAAEAERGQRRPARRHPGRADLRDADLAAAGEDGRPGHLAGGAARGAGPQQLPVGARPHQGVDGLGQPGGQHRPAHARGVPPAGRQGAERRRRPPRRDRGRRAGRRELRGGCPLRRRNGGVHGHLGPADGELAGGGRAGARRGARTSRPSCRPA